jgi:dihydrofolate reductase
MKLSLIAAIGKNRELGKDNQLLWKMPADLQYFKKVTLNKPILMGRKTFESIGRPLPGRENIIITRDKQYAAEGCTITHSLDDATKACSTSNEVMIIGGANIYQQAIDKVERMYLTFIDGEFDADVFFPAWEKTAWQPIEKIHRPADEDNMYDCQFVTLDKIS